MAEDVLLQENTVFHRYALNGKLAEQYLPEPTVRTNKHGNKIRLWRQSDVEKALENEALQREAGKIKEKRHQKKLARRAKRRAERKKLNPEAIEAAAIAEFMAKFDLEHMMIDAAYLRRRFVLHVGPTNSGKTYDAIHALMKAGSGAYLGPLRLLALEIFDKLNENGCRCDLVTGEEQELIDGAEHVASTVELCDFHRRYDVAVIDEAQLLADPFRGAHWTRAILGVNAAEVHVCFAPEALNLIEWLIKGVGAEYEIVRHKRLCPLEYAGKMRGLRTVEAGDALITFSRKSVLGLSAELEMRGYKTSVIYGALPPQSRREEVRKFAQGETQVVVATDAIGMGVSLPIRRIIFCDTQKYDGTQRRKLTPVEVKQIGGRAGRYGIYDKGEVLSIVDDDVVEKGLSQTPAQIKALIMPFPRAALESVYPLERLLKAWQEVPEHDKEIRSDLSDCLILLHRVDESWTRKISKALLYDLISCPVDTASPDLVFYWRDCFGAVVKDKELPYPRFDLSTLEGCEIQYRAYDIRSQMQHRIGVEAYHTEEKRELAAKINAFLAGDKQDYERKCAVCGKKLAFNWPYRVCDTCHDAVPRRILYEPIRHKKVPKTGRKPKTHEAR